MYTRIQRALLLLSVLGVSACGSLRDGVPLSPTLEVTLLPTRSHIPASTVIDPGLVHGTPCQAPCWYGLIPGKTTVKDILEMMPRLSASESPYDFPAEKNVVPSLIYLREQGLGGTIHLFMDWNKKVLKSIQSEPPLRFNYYLGELVKQFGEPEAIVGELKKEGTCEKWTPANDGPYGDNLDILYPQQGLLFSIRREAAAAGLICQEMPVVSFCYYPPMTMKEALTDNHLADFCIAPQLQKFTEESLLTWPGFSSSQ